MFFIRTPKTVIRSRVRRLILVYMGAYVRRYVFAHCGWIRRVYQRRVRTVMRLNVDWSEYVSIALAWRHLLAWDGLLDFIYYIKGALEKYDYDITKGTFTYLTVTIEVKLKCVSSVLQFVVSHKKHLTTDVKIKKKQQKNKKKQTTTTTTKKQNKTKQKKNKKKKKKKKTKNNNKKTKKNNNKKTTIKKQQQKKNKKTKKQ